MATYNHIWTNTEKSGRTIPTKGLGIFTRSDFKLNEVTDSQSQAPTSLVGKIETPSTKIEILAIWTQPSPRRQMHGTYMQSLADIFDDHSPLLRRRNCIVAGDFNVSASLSPMDFTGFFLGLKSKFGLVSAFHEANDYSMNEIEMPGTFWMTREDAKSSFHIDYVLLPEHWKIERAVIGGKDEWVGREVNGSDHAPLIVDFEWQRDHE